MITPYWERAEFPHHLVAKIAALGLGGATIKGYGCPGLGITANAMACLEMARVDASMATFFLVHNFLALLTVGLLVSMEALCLLWRASLHLHCCTNVVLLPDSRHACAP